MVAQETSSANASQLTVLWLRAFQLPAITYQLPYALPFAFLTSSVSAGTT